MKGVRFSVVNSFSKALLNLVYPATCAGTGSLLLPNEKWVSQFCLATLPKTQFFAFPANNMLLDQFVAVPEIRMAAAGYWYQAKQPIGSIIHKLKYNNKPEIGNVLGSHIFSETKESDFWKDVDCLVPIPLHVKRLRERGYNQSEYIANGIGQASGIPVMSDMLQRTRNNKSQTKMNRVQRLKNTEGLFVANETSSRCVVLVDDIITTGATVVAATAALSEAGVTEVRVCAIGTAAL